VSVETEYEMNTISCHPEHQKNLNCHAKVLVQPRIFGHLQTIFIYLRASIKSMSLPFGILREHFSHMSEVIVFYLKAVKQLRSKIANVGDASCLNAFGCLQLERCQ
jgi:hypothetical protein